MKKRNRNSKLFYEELMTKQAKQLAKTRKNKVSTKADEAWQPKLTVKQVDVSKAPYSMPDAGYGWKNQLQRKEWIQETVDAFADINAECEAESKGKKA